LSLALWPSLLLVIMAIAIAGRRVYVLAWQAPVAAAPLMAALQAQIARGELMRAIALCRALERAWAAECAEACLQASLDQDQDGAAPKHVVEELRVTYAQRAGQGLETLRALSRLSFPLALAAAIVTMSGAFGGADVTRVELALSTALQCLIVAVVTAVFCRVSAAMVSRQGAARMREIALVCRGTMTALAAGARSAPTQE
jgi:hypothetical protein